MRLKMCYLSSLSNSMHIPGAIVINFGGRGRGGGGVHVQVIDFDNLWSL